MQWVALWKFPHKTVGTIFFVISNIKRRYRLHSGQPMMSISFLLTKGEMIESTCGDNHQEQRRKYIIHHILETWWNIWVRLLVPQHRILQLMLYSLCTSNSHSLFIIYSYVICEWDCLGSQGEAWVLRTCICLSLATVQVSLSFAKTSLLSSICTDQHVKYNRSRGFPSPSNLLLSYLAK